MLHFRVDEVKGSLECLTTHTMRARLETHPHLDESIRRDGQNIRRKISDMAALSESALKGSVRALTERNRQLAYSIILRDHYIDEIETEVDRLCLEFIARHQPVAGDLRFVFATIQINRELERIGDYGESIARQALTLAPLDPHPPYSKFTELAEMAVRMLRDAVKAYLDQDVALATTTMAVEEQANSLRSAINVELRDLVNANRLPPESLTPLLTVARRLERVTDQAKNLCEEVLYMCTGEFNKHKGVQGFRMLFVDASHGVLSRMAERIATDLEAPGMSFTSAGITPQPLEAVLKEALAKSQPGISTDSPRSLEQVPNWEQFQVVVAFGKEVRDAIPVRPGKTMYFTWRANKLPAAGADASTLDSAIQQTRASVEQQVKDLVGAILQEPNSGSTL